VLMDAGYGNDTGLRTDITALGLRYVAGIPCRRSLEQVADDRRRGCNADSTNRSWSRHSPSACRNRRGKRTWREGTTDWLSSRFARWRVRPAHRDNLLSKLRAEEWLLIEWPEDETEPTKYWFSTLPEDTAFDRLVVADRARYQELKQELGLGDYEGRGWRGFHHHATLCIAAYGFLIAERAAFPPSGPPFSAPLSRSAIPDGYRSRGAADPQDTENSRLLTQ
jgi:SRSO17 transposase